MNCCYNRDFYYHSDRDSKIQFFHIQTTGYKSFICTFHIYMCTYRCIQCMQREKKLTSCDSAILHRFVHWLLGFFFSIAFVGMLSVFKIRLNFFSIFFFIVVYFYIAYTFFYSIVLMMIIYYKRLLHFTFHFLFPCNMQCSMQLVESAIRNAFANLLANFINQMFYRKQFSSEKRRVFQLINRNNQSFLDNVSIFSFQLYIVLDSERCGCFVCVFIQIWEVFSSLRNALSVCFTGLLIESN